MRGAELLPTPSVVPPLANGSPPHPYSEAPPPSAPLYLLSPVVAPGHRSVLILVMPCRSPCPGPATLHHVTLHLHAGSSPCWRDDTTVSVTHLDSICDADGRPCPPSFAGCYDAMAVHFVPVHSRHFPLWLEGLSCP